MVTIKHTRESIAELEQEREQFKQQRDSLIKDVEKLREEKAAIEMYLDAVKTYKPMYECVNGKYKYLTNYIKDKALHNPGVHRYIDLVHVIDELEKEWVIMAYDYEIKSGQRVFIENTNGQLYKATVININEYREPSMRVSLQVDGIEDIVFTGLENIKIMEDK